MKKDPKIYLTGQHRVLGKHILEMLDPKLPGKVKRVYKKVVEKI